MKRGLSGFGIAAFGFVVGALVVLLLARSASKFYLERESFAQTERMFSRAVQYEKEGDLQKAYALYFTVTYALDDRGPSKPERWDLALPLAYPILARIEESSDNNGKGTRNINAMYRAAFGHLLERLGRKDDADNQYSIAAKSTGVGVDRIRKLGEIVTRK